MMELKEDLVKTIKVKIEADIVNARGAGREMARKLGFGLADQTRLATAISELTRNIIRYAGEGVCYIRDKSDWSNYRILVEVKDHGPGIPDIEKAMSHGFSTGRSLGAGLPGARRLVHDFDIKSKVGSPGYTKISMMVMRPRV